MIPFEIVLEILDIVNERFVQNSFDKKQNPINIQKYALLR